MWRNKVKQGWQTQVKKGTLLSLHPGARPGDPEDKFLVLQFWRTSTRGGLCFQTWCMMQQREVIIWEEEVDYIIPLPAEE